MTIVGINSAVSFFLFGLASKNIWTEYFAIFLSDGIFLIAFCTYVFIIFKLRKSGEYVRTIFHDLTPVLISTTSVLMIKYFTHVDRPFITLGFTPLVVQLDPHGSFPSLHAAIFAAFAITLFFHYRRLGILLLSLLPLVMIGRIAIGVHWLTDVLAGAFIGSTVAIRFYWRKHKSKVVAEKLVNRYFNYRNKGTLK